MNELKVFPCHNITYAGRPAGQSGIHTRRRKRMRAGDWEEELIVLRERLRTMWRSAGRGAVVYTALLESRALHVCLDADYLLKHVRAIAPAGRVGDGA